MTKQHLEAQKISPISLNYFENETIEKVEDEDEENNISALIFFSNDTKICYCQNIKSNAVANLNFKSCY